MKLKVLLLGLTVLAAAIVLAACGGGSGSSGSASTSAEAQEIEDWPLFGRDRDNTRFATQDEIDTSNVGELGEAWSTGLGPDQYLMESFPLVIGETVYVTTSTDEVYAFDGATGRVKWKYAPQVNFSLSSGVGGYGISVNRGVAVSNGKVYLLTFDAQLKAISAKTGEEIFSTRVDDASKGAYETMSPTVYDGKVYVGNSGSDQGIAGFVRAYDATTGRLDWTFNTVPRVGTSWRRKGTGGGTVYMAPTVDTQSGRILVGTSNPSPAIVGTRRPGADLYTSSIVALDARTGRLAWYHQEVAHDLWDYDAASPVVLFDTTIDGKRTRVAAEAGKSGYLFILDAATGKDLFPRLAFVRENHTPPTTRGTLECPGPLGGSQYDPIAYSPRTNATYVSGIDFCFILRVSNQRLPGESHFGGTRSLPSNSKPTGSFSAVDMSTGRFLWRRKIGSPMGAGASVTASDLVFTLDQKGNIYAFDARTGATRWKADLGLAGASAPVIYTVKGTEYIAVTIGGSGLTSSNNFGPIGARVVVLKLGGRRIVPVKAPKNPRS